MSYLLYREYSSYRHELIDDAESEAQARSLACAHSRTGHSVVSVHTFTPAGGENVSVCSFLHGLPYTATKR